jgi:hypothetical protein
MASISQINERLALIGTIDPDAYSADTYTSDEIDMSNFKRVVFILSVGDLGSSATVDFEINGGASSNPGSLATLVTGKDATQLTQAGSDSDKQVIIEVSAEEAAAQGLQYLEAEVIVGTAACDLGLIVLGEPAHYSDTAGLDLATVAEVIG